MIDLRPGDTIYGPTEQDPYEIIDLVGYGSFGFVYEVRNKVGERYALKTIHTASLTDLKLRALVNEGKLATEVQHPNVVRVFYFHDGQQYPQFPPYMIMEYVGDGTLE